MKIIAICVLTNTTDNIKGNIEFIQEDNLDVQIITNISGLTKGKHGFHIHEAGDLTDNCKTLCKHFNPYNKNHGGPTSKERHVGDLGNLIADNKGNCKCKFTDSKIKLKGKNSIIGRSVVIHEFEDDLGQGGLVEYNYTKNNKTYNIIEIVDIKKREESLKTGNAGNRIACGVIGYSSKMFKH